MFKQNSSFVRKPGLDEDDLAPPEVKPMAIKTFARKLVTIVAPAELTATQGSILTDALRAKDFRVETIRIEKSLDVASIIGSLEGSFGVLIGMGANPTIELEVLRAAQASSLPRIRVGVICLSRESKLPAGYELKGPIDFVFKRYPKELVFSGYAMHTMLTERLDHDAVVEKIALTMHRGF